MASSFCLRARRRTRAILAVAKAGDAPNRIVGSFIVTLILLNVAAMVAESVQSIHVALSGFFTVFECFSVAVFSVEYALRLWSCVEVPEYGRSVLGRLRFALTPLAVVDLMAVLPFYLPFVTMDLRVLRMFRLFRIMRIMRVAKLARYSESLQMLMRVLRAKKEPLIGAIFILVILLVVAASLMYYAENEAQPEAFSSIPAAMWWAAATLTTVGYGDIFPVTAMGKLMGSIIAILGIGMFALPTGILGAGFVEELDGRRNSRQCPHCGKEIVG